MAGRLRLGSAVALLMLVAGAGWQACAQPAVRTIEQLNRLSHDQADRGLAVRIEGTVTFVQPYDGSLFVESDGHGTYVNFARDKGLKPGDRVVVKGVTDASFRPEVTATDVEVLGHGSLPKPVRTSFPDLIRARFDSRYVVVKGHVLSAAMDKSIPIPGMRLKLSVPEGEIEGRIAYPGSMKPEDMLDSEVDLTGVAGGAFDSRMEMAGVWLDVNSDKDVTVLRRAPASPWATPEVPLDEVLYAYRPSSKSERVHVTGTLTYYVPTELAVIEHHGRAMLVETGVGAPIAAGTPVEVTGFPEVVGGSVRITEGQIRATSDGSQVTPTPIDWEHASTGKFAYSLVAMEGEVVALVPDSRVILMVLKSEGHLYSATLRRSSGDSTEIGSQAIPEIGSRVRVTGVCFVDSGDHWRDRLWFDVRLRSLKDLVTLQAPSWWTVKRLAYVSTLLSIVILGAVIWAGLLDRRVRRQNAILARQSQEDAIRERRAARQEQSRSYILELINSTRPLPEVLAEIRKMVSTRLFGAPCWFELTGTAGEFVELERPTAEGVVSREMFSPDGSLLGKLMAAPVKGSTSEAELDAALNAGARLAELAIDTRRLYSDLRHRSEFDLLTDIPNRFSMEKHLDQLMASAHLRRGDDKAIFGLIYVDLDKFKEVNDRHGHRVGDLYLQAVTARMKFQLRNGDVLARVGGDEFIALVPILRSRADAEEIVVRLERSFDEPFEIEGVKFIGSASVGLAVYPEDGDSKEELQRAADAQMYAHKESKKAQELRDEAIRSRWSDGLA